MQQSFDVLDNIEYLVGDVSVVKQILKMQAKEPFDEDIVEFLNEISKILMQDSRIKKYPDVVTFAFWIRKASILQLKEKYLMHDKTYLRLGKGVVFHISPSNVPVNFAYSLVSSLLCGNANVVRVSSKIFPQVDIISEAINRALDGIPKMKSYVVCVRYERDKAINDWFSSVADERIIWGGDQTIAEVRKSPLPARSGEITFSDRYSLAIIDSDKYLDIVDKERVAEGFYNDTYLFDQNACTSPRVIIWTGKKIDESKKLFWEIEHSLLKRKYRFQSIQSIDKLSNAYCFAATHKSKIEKHIDNLITRVELTGLTDDLMEYSGNSGFFFEYDCKDILELVPICNNKRCQTIGYIGDKNDLLPLINSGVKGIDRVVPIGHTTDFDFIWDGYNLLEQLTRIIVIK